MTGFCVETIAPESNLRPHHGVLRINALAVTSDARLAAEQILEKAHEEAEAILQAARVEAQYLVREREEQTLQRADHLLHGLAKAQEMLLQRSQELVVDLAQGVFNRLVMDMTPREKITAAFKRVLHEAPPKLINPVLRVHPEDFELVPTVEWEIKPDATIERGTCLLEADSGEWRAEFSAAVAALKTGFVQVTEEPAGNAGNM